MGLQFCCKKNEQSINHSKNIEAQDIYPGNVDVTKFPDDQYLCPFCDKIPEILNIHSDNGHIELKCKLHGLISLTLKDYLEKMKDNLFTYYKTKCFNCNKEQNNKDNMFKYCYYCKVDFCEDCLNNFHQAKKDHRRNHLDVCIPVNAKNHKCLEHFNSDIISFCMDCQENICEKESSTKHRGHEKINFTKYEKDINKYMSFIKAKNKLLGDIINFNNIILNSYENFQNNYFHIQSLINIGKTIEDEYQRNSKELDIMISGLEKSHKIQEEAIKSLQKQFLIDLNGNERKLSLRKRNLGDIGFKLISKIQFLNLKEIDVSDNSIKDIQPLNNMILPHLEYLNMSYNNISDFSSFLQSNFPQLERLRIENNNFDSTLSESKELINEKYKNKVFYIERTAKDFKKKYGVDINLEDEVMNLNHLKGKDELLQELYLIIKPENKIKELRLDDNEIKNASLISRMPLNMLKLLDLSLNEITNLQFLTEMKLPKLTTIYLNANKINDISPLITITEADKNHFSKLHIISLRENNLKVEDKDSEKLIKTLLGREIELDLELPKKKK